jgi:uncharacterized protein (TIGR00290 family)
LSQSPAKTFFNWSTGKDSALALYHLQRNADYQVDCLLTSVNAAHDRVSMHGLRREFMLAQADAIGLPLKTIELPEQPDMPLYESKMSEAVSSLKAGGFSHAAFGDIFLEDLRRYREEKLATLGLKAVFPLWQRNTRDLMREFIGLGFKAVVVCVNTDYLDASFAGRLLDESFLADLPPGVDPCGEKGEFHTFCFAGPVFRREIPFALGEKVLREYPAPAGGGKAHAGFCFCDILPA